MPRCLSDSMYSLNAPLVCAQERHCLLCTRGLKAIKSILGCRESRSNKAELEYYVRWSGRPFRDACWVRLMLRFDARVMQAGDSLLANMVLRLEQGRAEV